MSVFLSLGSLYHNFERVQVRDHLSLSLSHTFCLSLFLAISLSLSLSPPLIQSVFLFVSRGSEIFPLCDWLSRSLSFFLSLCCYSICLSHRHSSPHITFSLAHTLTRSVCPSLSLSVHFCVCLYLLSVSFSVLSPFPFLPVCFSLSHLARLLVSRCVSLFLGLPFLPLAHSLTVCLSLSLSLSVSCSVYRCLTRARSFTHCLALFPCLSLTSVPLPSVTFLLSPFSRHSLSPSVSVSLSRTHAPSFFLCLAITFCLLSWLISLSVTHYTVLVS